MTSPASRRRCSSTSAAVDGTRLEVTVEITATNPAGFPPDKSRVVTENARTLKFDQFGFEDR